MSRYAGLPWSIWSYGPSSCYDDHNFSLVRVPNTFIEALQLQVHSHPDLGIAWLRALIVQYAGLSLLEIRRIDKDLLPAFLAPQYYRQDQPRTIQGYSIEEYLCHQENTIFLSLPPAVRHLAPLLAKRKGAHRRAEVWLGSPRPQQEPPGEVMKRHTAAIQTCAHKTGYASQGMLCNEPPIPLRVLDFLGTYELVNLSLVCKAMHQAGHVLLEREVAALPANLLESKGQPNFEGWAHLKRGRKEGMFMGIIGVVLGSELPAEPPLQRGFAGNVGAAARNIAATPAFLPSAAVLPPSMASKSLAEVEKENQGPLEFWGKLDAAKDLMVTFQLASEGRLRAKLRPDVRSGSHVRAEKIDRAVRRWAAGCGELGKLSRQERRERLCQYPQDRGISGRDDMARDMRRRRREGSGMPDASAELCAQNEEILQGKWPSREGRRHEKYAVIALDRWKTKQVKGHWPRGKSETAVEEEGACIVAAAQAKGQGLLLTVETLDFWRPR